VNARIRSLVWSQKQESTAFTERNKHFFTVERLLQRSPMRKPRPAGQYSSPCPGMRDLDWNGLSDNMEQARRQQERRQSPAHIRANGPPRRKK